MYISSALIVSILIILILILVNRYLFKRMKGDIDFSVKKTRIILLISIIWVLLLWFLIPVYMEWIYDINTSRLSDEDLKEILIFRISFTILLSIPIWIYWAIRPIYKWFISGSDS